MFAIPRRALVALAFVSVLMAGTAVAQEDCGGYNRSVVFADLDWDSVQVINGVARTILEAGFGCDTDAIPGSTIPLYQGAIRGDIDVIMEIWTDNVPDFWPPAVEAGTVVELGHVFDDAIQGWYVPRYLVEGDAERGIEALAPDLRSVEDLPRYASLFRDPEQPNLGRFYNCIIGWACEVVNNVKFYAYGLDEHFTNFNPGTGVALATSMEAAYLQGEPWFGYYWAPTWVLGELDMLRLEEPAFTQACWDAIFDVVDTPEQGDVACAYPTSTAIVALGSNYKDQVSPEIREFLGSVRMGSDLINELLAYMQRTGADPSDTAAEFLRTQPEVWTAWVDEDTVARVQAAIGQ